MRERPHSAAEKENPVTALIAPEGRIIVKVNDPESVLDNGIVIPESARENSLEAIVVSSGYEGVDSGDRVILLDRYSGSSFSFDGIEYVSLIPEEILGVIEES